MPLARARLTALCLASALVPAGVLVVGTGAAGAADADLGTAASFLVLAGSTVTNTGPTVVGGDLGLSPGTSVTGFPPGTVGGTIHVNDGVAVQAKADASTAYDAAAGLPVTETVTADLGGQTLTPGVYAAATGLGLTGTLTLDGGGDPAAAFVLRAGSTLTTASSSSVLLVNGANPCNVTWVVGSSATLGTGSTLVGTVLASTSITATTGATVQGRLLARTGAVTLDTNTLSRPVCTAAVSPGPVVSTTPSPTAAPSASTTPTPTPSATPAPSASAGPSASTAPTPTTSASPSAAAPVPTALPSVSSSAVPAPVPVSGGSVGGSVPGPSDTPTATSSGAPSVPQLPRTGADATTVAAWGALLALVGAGLTIAGATPAPGQHRAARRRPRRAVG